MRSLRYLNTVLTVIAVLLTLNVWTLWHVSPGGDALSLSRDAHAQGSASAASQRSAMVTQLKQINSNIKGLEATLKAGNVRVKVDRLPEKK